MSDKPSLKIAGIAFPQRYDLPGRPAAAPGRQRRPQAGVAVTRPAALKPGVRAANLHVASTGKTIATRDHT